MAAVRSMAAVRYYRNGRPSTVRLAARPRWEQVESAVRRMDDFYFPIVALSCLECDSDEELFEDGDSLHLIGGRGRIALFQNDGQWRYENPNGSTTEVSLWKSDQGYFCQERNVLADLGRVLQLMRSYFECGNCGQLDDIAAAWR